MSLNLPDSISLPTNPGRHNTAIAEIVIWSIVFVCGITIRSIQEWHYWDHRHSRKVFRCIVYAWFRNMVVALAQARIVGFAMYLAIPNAKKGVVITEVVLQGVGVSPLVLELTLVLLKCGRIGLYQQKSTYHYTQVTKLLLLWTRLPILITIVLICVAGGIVNTGLIKAGATVIMATFVYVVLVMIYMFFNGDIMALPASGKRAICCLVAALPFYIVRVVYIMLSDFGGIRFSPAVGDWKLAVGLEFVMEVMIVLCLMAAMLFAQPILGQSRKKQAGQVEIPHELAKDTQFA